MCKDKRIQKLVRKVAYNHADEVWSIYERRDMKDLTTMVLVDYSTLTARFFEIHGGSKEKKLMVTLTRTIKNCHGFDPYNSERGYQELLRQARVPRLSYAVRER